MSNSISDILKERDFLLDKKCLFSHLFLEVKYYLAAILIGCVAIFGLYNSFFINFENNTIIFGMLTVLSIIISMFIFIGCCGVLFDSDFKVISNSTNYLNKTLKKEEMLYLRKILPELDGVGVNLYQRALERRINEIDKKFMDKEVLKEFFTYLRENPLDTEEHMDFFEEKLTEFNERNNKQLAKVKKINAKLKTAGLDLFSENDESLELKIKEN
jgi:hypothetical protein